MNPVIQRRQTTLFVCCRFGLIWITLLSMTPDNEEIPPSRWYESLESLTNQREDGVVTIEVLSIDLGDEFEAEKLLFAYIGYDRHDDDVNVAVGGRDGRYPVILRHAIEHPQSVVVSWPNPRRGVDGGRKGG
jgi:Family of unknown function (DUF5335)